MLALAFGGSSGPSPTVIQERAAASPRPPQAPSKSVAEVIAILRTQPGGSAAIAAAVKGGARIPSPPKGTDLTLKAPPIGKFKVTLDVDNLKVGNNWVEFEQVDVLRDSSLRLKRFQPRQYVMRILFNAPRPGYYVLWIDGRIPPNQEAAASIRHTSNSPTESFQTWTFGKNTGNQPAAKVFPVLIGKPSNYYPMEFTLTKGEFLFDRVTLEEL